MDNKITVFIAQSREEEVDEVKNILEGDNFVVIGKTTDGLRAESFFSQNKTDLAVLDITLKNIDGYTLIETIKKKSPQTKIVIISNLTHPSFSSKALELGASSYLKRPCTQNAIKETCLAVQAEEKIEKTSLDGQKSIDKKLSNIFITVGIPAHIKGYQFLREAIKLAIDTPEIINSITKKLYPSIAEKFETSSSKVERAIRHAIEVAWNRGKIENINDIFGLKVYSANDKPTNGEFIALVADKMLIEA